MIPGGDIAPFRAKFPEYGICRNPSHGRLGLVRKVFKNTTSIPKVLGDGTPDGYTVDGTGRSAIEALLGNEEVTCPDTSVCSSKPAGTGVDYDGTNYGVDNLIGPWLTLTPVNTFADAETTIDLAVCNMVGRQSVFGHRQWHGAWGFLNDDANCPDSAGCDVGFVRQNWRSWHPTPATTKYCTGTFDSRMAETAEFVDNFYDATAAMRGLGYLTYTYDRQNTYTAEIDPHSGCITLTGITSTLTDNYHYAGPVALKGVVAGVDVWLPSGVPIAGSPFPPAGDVYTESGVDLGDVTAFSTWLETHGIQVATYGNFSTSIVMGDWLAALTACGGQFSAPISGYDSIGGSWNAYKEFTNQGVMDAAAMKDFLENECLPFIGNYPGSTATTSLTDTELSVSIAVPVIDLGPGGGPDSSGTLTITALSFSLTLDDANTSAAVIEDAEDLMAPWDFKDHVLFPFTNDEWRGIAVLVSRNEVRMNVSLPLYQTDPDSYVDPNIALLTFDDGVNPGDILGLPNPATEENPSADNTVPGTTIDYPEDYFDPRYINMKGCCPEQPDPTPSSAWFVQSYGGWRSDAGSDLPPRATQWTNVYQAFALSHGRIRRYGRLTDVYSDVNPDASLWVSKWAESVIRLPSYDHARTYGADRLLETPTGTCDGDSPPDGTWTPDGLRFPSCPPFGGRLAISSIVDNMDGTCTVTHDATTVLIDDAVPSLQLFPVNLCDLGMTMLAGNLTVTTLSLTQFTVTASFATVSAARWVTLYGAMPGDPPQTGVASWYWADRRGKGQFVLLEWSLNPRPNGEYARLDGVLDCDGVQVDRPSAAWPPGGPFTTVDSGYDYFSALDKNKGFLSCTPWKIVLSPNETDTPPEGAGVRYDFEHTSDLDEAYGSQQWLIASQAMENPLFIPLPSDDQQACDGSEPPTCIYDFVEARAILPHANSDTLPPDNGAGDAQDEDPPAPPIDYTILDPTVDTAGLTPPEPGEASDVPVATLIPSGVFEPCA